MIIRTHIWVVFILYLIYTIASTKLFFLTADGWLAFFFYLIFTGLFYIISSMGLLFKAAFRSSKRRSNVKLNIELLLRVIALQLFVVLFNYDTCGDTICYQGFLPEFLEMSNIPVWFSPPFTLVLLALIFYIFFLSSFLMDIH